jgi:hypothetical protein
MFLAFADRKPLPQERDRHLQVIGVINLVLIAIGQVYQAQGNIGSMPLTFKICVGCFRVLVRKFFNKLQSRGAALNHNFEHSGIFV